MLRILTRDGRVLVDGLQLPEEGVAQIPGTDSLVEVLATTEDLQGRGPAAQLTLLDPSGGHAHQGEPFVVAQFLPELDRRRGGDLIFQLAGLLPGTPYTGLQVAKDPGVPLIWAGAVLLTVGCFLAFFLSHRRLWVRLEGGTIHLAGVATRNQPAFQEVFTSLEQELREKTVHVHVPRRAAG